MIEKINMIVNLESVLEKEYNIYLDERKICNETFFILKTDSEKFVLLKKKGSSFIELFYFLENGKDGVKLKDTKSNTVYTLKEKNHE